MKREILSLLRLAEPYRERMQEGFHLRELLDFEPSRGDILPESVRNAAGLVTTGGRHGATAALIESMPRLEIIACHSVGYNAVDLAAARSRGIVVTHAPDVLSSDVADYAIAMMLASSLRLVEADRFVRNGRWAHSTMRLSRSLRGLTVGILGLGRIGKLIAESALSLGATPVYHNRQPLRCVPYEYFADLEKMANASDILVVSCIGSDTTKGIVNRRILDAIGPDGLLVNVARGLIIDERALVEALKDGRLGAAALDVFEAEPHVPQDLFSMENVILSPHYAAGTHNSRSALARNVLENISAYFCGNPVPNPTPQ